MLTAIPAITVSTIFIAWNACRRRERERRDRQLRERVAHMLWVAANEIDDEPDNEEEAGPDPPNNDLERRLTAYTSRRPR
jgi:hypothetical protein